MEKINFQKNKPMFGDVSNSDMITTQRPYEVFVKQTQLYNTSLFYIDCSCGDPDCKNRVNFLYSGLNYYTNRGRDNHVSIDIHAEDKERTAKNIMWNSTKDNVDPFLSFLETTQKAILFKQELTRDFFAELEVVVVGSGYNTKIKLIVRKEESIIMFYLFEISNFFKIVPLVYEAKSYRECLGPIASFPLPTGMDISRIKNGYTALHNPFLKPIIEWVKLLGSENDQILNVLEIFVISK